MRTCLRKIGIVAAIAVIWIAGCKNTVEEDKKADESAPAAVTNLTATAKDARVLLHGRTLRTVTSTATK